MSTLPIDRLRLRHAAAAIALGLLTGGCVDETPVQPRTNTLVVHAVLDASARDQAVSVLLTRGTEQSQRPIRGAVVALSLPDGRRFVASEETDSIARFRYHFSLDSLGFELVPGGTYRLDVEAPDGRVVTGHTTIPNVAAGAATAPEQQLNAGDTLRLAWARVPAARRYEVTVVAVAPNRDDIFSSAALFVDTAVALTAATKTSSGDDLFIRGLLNRLAVAAVDSNYYDYYRRDSDPFTGVGLITHLEGAEGVFGAIVPIQRRLLNVR